MQPVFDYDDENGPWWFDTATTVGVFFSSSWAIMGSWIILISVGLCWDDALNATLLNANFMGAYAPDEQDGMPWPLRLRFRFGGWRNCHDKL